MRLGATESHAFNELLVSCIQQVASQKQTFRMFLQFSQENLNLLPACLEKCFTISDAWHTCTQEILLYKKLFIDDYKDEQIDGESQNDKDYRKKQEQKMRNFD